MMLFGKNFYSFVILIIHKRNKFDSTVEVKIFLEEITNAAKPILKLCIFLRKELKSNAEINLTSFDLSSKKF
jgi:hypothetical protein